MIYHLIVQYNVLKINDSNLIDVDMSSYLKFFHINLELSYIVINGLNVTFLPS